MNETHEYDALYKSTDVDAARSLVRADDYLTAIAWLEGEQALNGGKPAERYRETPGRTILEGLGCSGEGHRTAHMYNGMYTEQQSEELRQEALAWCIHRVDTRTEWRTVSDNRYEGSTAKTTEVRIRLAGAHEPANPTSLWIHWRDSQPAGQATLRRVKGRNPHDVSQWPGEKCALGPRAQEVVESLATAASKQAIEL